MRDASVIVSLLSSKPSNDPEQAYDQRSEEDDIPPAVSESLIDTARNEEIDGIEDEENDGCYEECHHNPSLSSMIELDLLLFIVRGSNNDSVAVTVTASQELIGLSIIHVGARPALSPDFHVIVEAVPDDFILSQCRTNHPAEQH